MTLILKLLRSWVADQRPLMKKSFLFSAFLSLAISVYSQKIIKIKVNELETIINASLNPLVITFWATWCTPCIEEIPYFQEVVKKYGRSNVELLMVSLDFPKAYPNQIQAFTKKKRITSKVVWLDETNADVFCPKIDDSWSGGIPATLFVNNKSNYRKFFESRIPRKEFEKQINTLIK